jgi:hypothetical protein
MRSKTFWQYWKMVCAETRKKASDKLGIGGRFLGLFVATVGSAIVSFAIGGNAMTNMIVAAVTAGVWALIWLGVFLWYWTHVPVIVHNKQEDEIDKLQKLNKEKDTETQELEEKFSVKELQLYVNHGRNFFETVGEVFPKMYLMIDVVNLETRKIVDLEAYLTSVEQITEELPDNKSFSISFRTERLQWKDGNYIINLIPSWPETPLKIASLDFSNSTFMFIHEGDHNKLLPSLQKDALYKIRIGFKGKLDGDPEYRFCKYDTEFVCLLHKSGLHYLPEAANLPDLPEGLKRKIRVPPEEE